MNLKYTDDNNNILVELIQIMDGYIPLGKALNNPQFGKGGAIQAHFGEIQNAVTQEYENILQATGNFIKLK